ncbi:MAG: response regulator [Anaerolineales bacterium]
MEQSKISLIIIDDHPIFRQGVGDVLALETDFEIAAYASDGMNGLEIIRQIKPQVAIVDVNLPGMNGQALAAAVAFENLPTKLIFLTADSEKQNIIYAMKMGVAAYCTKDIAPEDLVEIIRSVLKGFYIIEGRRMSQIEVQNWLKDQIESVLPSMETRRNRLESLSPRERDVLLFLTQGRTNKEIAQTLGISHQTVKNHVTAIMRKIGVGDRTQAALYALKHDWLFNHPHFDKE